MVVLLVILTIIGFIAAKFLFDFMKKGSAKDIVPAEAAALVSAEHGAFKLLDRIDEPAGLFYNPGHTWAFLEMNGKVKIGVDRFFQQVVGKIDAIELPAVGDHVEQGSHALLMKSGGRTVRAKIPVTGKIEAVNEAVVNNPGILNSEAFTDGWILRIGPSNFLEDIKVLKFGQDANQWIKNEITKLKELLSQQFSDESIVPQTAYDGGIPVYGVSALLNEQLWDRVRKEYLGDDS